MLYFVIRLTGEIYLQMGLSIGRGIYLMVPRNNYLLFYFVSLSFCQGIVLMVHLGALVLLTSRSNGMQKKSITILNGFNIGGRSISDQMAKYDNHRNKTITSKPNTRGAKQGGVPGLEKISSFTGHRQKF